MKLLIVVFAIILVFTGNYLDASELFHEYIDTPVFNLLPNDSITDVFRVFGESKIYKTPLAHNYVLYYDYSNKVGLIFCIYQSDNEHIWEITIRKERSKNPIQELHKHASLRTSPQQENTKVEKPPAISLNGRLTRKGIKLGMSPKEVEYILKTKLPMKGNEAYIGWDIREGNDIVNYGGQEFIFHKGSLISLSWSGVDP
jgi:hypothetical protein